MSNNWCGVPFIEESFYKCRKKLHDVQRQKMHVLILPNERICNLLTQSPYEVGLPCWFRLQEEEFAWTERRSRTPVRKPAHSLFFPRMWDGAVGLREDA